MMRHSGSIKRSSLDHRSAEAKEHDHLFNNRMDVHGDAVEADSGGVGQGSEFVVRPPIVSEPPLPPDPSVDLPVSAVARRILVVDDNQDSAECLTMWLKLNGYEVHTVQDGLEAVEAAQRFQPDVVLLDIGLPRLNGYEAARRIRQQQRDKGLLMVALTGWGHEEDRHRSEEAGCDTHLVKPVDFDTLMKLLVGWADAGRK